MRIKVNQNNLSKYLQMLQGVIERKHTIPILSNILVESTKDHVFLIATDLDIGIRTQCAAEVLEEGNVTIPGKRLSEIFKELTPGIDIELKSEPNNLVQISGGPSLYRIVGLPADDYPSFPSFTDVQFHPLPTNESIEMISQTLFSSSGDEGRSVLNGVLLEIGDDLLRLVATDGHRLALRKKSIKTSLNEKMTGESMIIPRKALRELVKILTDIQKDCAIGFSENKLIFQTENVQLFSRKIDGKFPNYNHVIPKTNDKVFKIDREILISSLKRVSLMSDFKSRGVLFHLGKDLLTMKSSNPEIGDAKEEMGIVYAGEEMDVMFNAHYLAEGLSVISDKEMVFSMGGKKSPALIRMVDSEDFMYIVMPMQLDQE
jgi:DNA polymerase III subunit beta